MALPTTGPITMTMVADELGISPTGLSLGDPRVRELAGKPTGPIGLSDLRGKSSGPPPPVEFTEFSMDGGMGNPDGPGELNGFNIPNSTLSIELGYIYSEPFGSSYPLLRCTSTSTEFHFVVRGNITEFLLAQPKQFYASWAGGGSAQFMFSSSNTTYNASTNETITIQPRGSEQEFNGSMPPSISIRFDPDGPPPVGPR